MEQIRIGIFGAGTIAERSHIPGSLRQLDVELVAICDTNEARAHTVAARHSIPQAFSNPEELLDQDIDAVIIGTPNVTHAALAIQALEAGKHVLVDKPPTISAETTRHAVSAAERNGRLFMPLFNHRFRPEVVAGRDLVDSRQLGDIYYAKTSVLDRRGATSGWLTDPALSGGGALIDLGVHHLDWTLFMLGYPRPVSVYGQTYKQIGNYHLTFDRDINYAVADMRGKPKPDNWAGTVEEAASAIIRFEDGLTLFFETAWAMNVVEDFQYTELFGARGGVRVDPSPVTLAVEENGYLVNKIYQTEEIAIYPDTHARAIRHFVKSIKGEETPISTPDHAITIMEIIDAIYKSQAEGTLIQLA